MRRLPEVCIPTEDVLLLPQNFTHAKKRSCTSLPEPSSPRSKPHHCTQAHARPWSSSPRASFTIAIATCERFMQRSIFVCRGQYTPAPKSRRRDAKASREASRRYDLDCRCLPSLNPFAAEATRSTRFRARMCIHALICLPLARRTTRARTSPSAAAPSLRARIALLIASDYISYSGLINSLVCLCLCAPFGYTTHLYHSNWTRHTSRTCPLPTGSFSRYRLPFAFC